MNAESAYLFRHAVMRDAAYQLHMPADRARLHRLVLEILEDLFADNSDLLDANAAEMADHARAGLPPDTSPSAQSALLARELEYCRRAASMARRTFQIDESVRQNLRVAQHPLATPEIAALALADAAELRHESGASALGAQLARDSLARAEAAQSPRALSRAHGTLGRCLHGLAKQGDSMRALESSVVHARESGDAKLLASALVVLARVRNERGDTQVMHTLLAEADSLMAKSGELAGRGEIMVLLASHEHDQTHETDRCVAQGLAALELMKRAGSMQGEGGVLHSLGVMCANAGRADQAEDFYKRALAIFEQTGSRPKQATLVHNLAQLDLFFRHRYRAALGRYELAYLENREMGLPGPESSEAATIAGMWRRLGQPEKALPYSLRAYELMSQADSAGGLANASGYLGDTLFALGRLAEAEQKLRFAIHWHTENKTEPEDLADFHESLAQLLRSTGRLNAAEQQFEKAEQLLFEAKLRSAALLVQFERGLLRLDAAEQGSVAARAIAELWQLKPEVAKLSPKPRLVRRLLPAMRACLLGLGEFTPARLPTLIEQAEEAAAFGELRSAIDVGPVLENLNRAAAELEQAAKENRKARLFAGFLPNEYSPLLRLALLDRLRQQRPDDYAELESQNPALLEQMHEGTSSLQVPQWDKREEL